MEITGILKQLPYEIYSYQPVVGGDINHSFHLRSDAQDFFLKVHPHMPVSFFRAEMLGLEKLSEKVKVPQVFEVGEYAGASFLLMEWIQPGSGNQADAGRQLARLHGCTEQQFGFFEDNYMGILPQRNTWHESWWDFFIKERIRVQVKLAEEGNRWNAWREQRLQSLLERFYQENHEKIIVPSLLHGDMWSGNLLFTETGVPVFLDPAAYYGDREMDLAMVNLFGGFRSDFLAGYQEYLPLAPDWRKRQPVYQLYYLLAHLNMFGESYGQAVDQILTMEE